MVEMLTNDSFAQKVFDFRTEKDWNYQGEEPCVIDFYADWCSPCKMVAPVLESLSKKYDGKVKVYKVNTDQQQEVAAAFGITSIPSLLFVPKTGQPQMAVGVLSQKTFEQAFDEILGVKLEAAPAGAGCC